MKKSILTTIVMAVALGCYADSGQETPVTPPTHVINALNEMRELYGDKDHVLYRRTISPDDNRFISSMEIIPFECPSGQGILTKVKAAFMDDKECAYRFLQVMPGELGAWIVGTGDYKGEELRARDRTPQEYIAMYVKNAKDPEMRDYYGVVWEYGNKSTSGFDEWGERLKNVPTQKSDVIKGKIYIITSRRDALQKDRVKKESVSDKEKSQQKANESWKKNGVASLPVTKGNTDVEKQLNAYKQLLEMQEEQIQKLRRDYDRQNLRPEEKALIQKRILKLHKEAERTTNKIAKLITKVR